MFKLVNRGEWLEQVAEQPVLGGNAGLCALQSRGAGRRFREAGPAALGRGQEKLVCLSLVKAIGDAFAGIELGDLSGTAIQPASQLHGVAVCGTFRAQHGSNRWCI